MWHDPLDELITDLEDVLPPEESRFGGSQEAFNEVHHWAEVILRRADEVYPNPIDPDDPEMQEAAEKGVRAMNRFVGRPEDLTPVSHNNRRQPPTRASLGERTPMP